MEIRQLMTFIRVVQFQSFTKAAQSLGYSQSAVTIQIKNLEHELGTHLLDRIGRQVSLTPQGERFLDYAYNIVNEMNRARMELNENKELTGSLRIGTVESLCFSKLPPVLAEMHGRYPDVALQIKATSPEDALEMIMAGATAVSVGTANFRNQEAAVGVIDGIKAYLEENGIADVKELIGCVS